MSLLCAPPLFVVDRSEPNSVCYRERGPDRKHFESGGVDNVVIDRNKPIIVLVDHDECRKNRWDRNVKEKKCSELFGAVAFGKLVGWLSIR